MNLDVNTIRVLVTVSGLFLFLLLVVHSYSRARRAEHEEAAQLPFMGEETDRE
jgi:cbb3-type cytochrome oxidase subunit 3